MLAAAVVVIEIDVLLFYFQLIIRLALSEKIRAHSPSNSLRFLQFLLIANK